MATPQRPIQHGPRRDRHNLSAGTVTVSGSGSRRPTVSATTSLKRGPKSLPRPIRPEDKGRTPPVTEAVRTVDEAQTSGATCRDRPGRGREDRGNRPDARTPSRQATRPRRFLNQPGPRHVRPMTRCELTVREHPTRTPQLEITGPCPLGPTAPALKRWNPRVRRH